MSYAIVLPEGEPPLYCLQISTDNSQFAIYETREAAEADLLKVEQPRRSKLTIIQVSIERVKEPNA